MPDIAEAMLTPAQRASYEAQIQQTDENGDLIYRDEESRALLLASMIDASPPRPFREMTVEELRGLVDTIKQIEHLGRLKGKLLTARGDREFAEVRDEVADTIVTNAANSGKNTPTATDWVGRKVQGLKQFAASHIKAAGWARIMDGGKDGGPVWEYLVRPANERANEETARRAELTARLDAIMRPILKKVPKWDRIGKGQRFDSIGRSLNWEGRFAMALNVGNASNLQRLLGGNKWSIDDIKPVLDTLTAEEWEAVQAIWDTFEQFRPEIAALERRVNGREPKWIEPSPVVTKYGQRLKGGYFPVRFDSRNNLKAQQHSDAEEAKSLMSAAYSAASTRRSFVKNRVDEVHGRPLLLSLQGMYSGFNDVIHDLAWREWLIDANRLLRADKVDDAIREHYGPEVKRELERWRDDIAAGTRQLDHASEKFAAVMRQGISASGIAFNVMSAMKQPLGFTQSIVRVGAQWAARGLAHYVSNPVRATREARQKSQFMMNRSRTRFRELNELRNQVQGQTAPRELMAQYSYWLLLRVQQMVDVPTWWAGYEKAIAQGNDEERAVALADQGVKDSQGGGEEVDQAGVERGGQLSKLFTVFYSFMNTAANLGYVQAKTPRSKAKLAVDLLLLYSVPVVLGQMIVDTLTPGGDDDDEELIPKLIRAHISQLIGLIAFGREFDQAAKALTGDYHDYTGPAGLRAITDVTKLGQQVSQGEFDDAFRKSLINTVGDFTGLPAAQANKTITGAQALAEGETENPAALVFGFQR
jgi:hypothetical protein